MPYQAFYDKIYRYVKKEYYENTLYGLNSYNGCYLSEDFRNYIELWELWYSGYLEEFHHYNYYNGINYQGIDKKRLNMAKKVCEDKASLLLNEKFDINLDDNNAGELLKEILKHNKFRSKANELIERANASGTGAFVQFLEKDKIMIDYVTARNIVPVTTINSEIINCAFVSTLRYGDDVRYYLNTHIMLHPAQNEFEAEKRIESGIPVDYEGYIVENRILRERSGEFIEDRQDGEVVDYVLTGTTIPFFQIIKPNIANNICLSDFGNGMGISVFANALTILEAVDNAYDNLDNEVVAGRKRIIVHDKFSTINVSGTGEDRLFKPVFDQSDTVFFAMDLGDKTPDPVKEIDMNLRISDCEDALNKQLSILSMRCGLGNNYYRFEGGQVKTATEVMSDNNPLFRTIKKDELVLKEALINMTKAILYMSNLDTEQDINVMFDDSIFEDTNQIRQNKLLEYNTGIIDKVQYFIDVYKMTEEQAIKHVQDMEARQAPEIAVDVVEEE